MRDQKLIFVGVELMKEIELVRQTKVNLGMYSLYMIVDVYAAVIRLNLTNNIRM